MRFLTTCLLLFCFQSFVVCTIEDGSVTIAQKTITKSKSDQLTLLRAKDLASHPVVATSFQFTDIIQHSFKNSLSYLPVFSKFVIAEATLKLIKISKETTNHGYHFIFSCLYPTHNFW